MVGAFDAFSGREHDSVLYPQEACHLIFFDSGAWFSSVFSTDPDLASATAWLADMVSLYLLAELKGMPEILDQLEQGRLEFEQ